MNTMIIDQQMLWNQFSVSLNDLEKAIRDCPQDLWQVMLWPDEPDQWVMQGFSNFWYLCYHTIFWLDLYLTGKEEGFMPPEPFDLVEMVDDEVLPRVYSPDELVGYLDLVRERTRTTIEALDAESAAQPCSFPWGTVPFGELLLYVLRHVQEHAGQLNMFIGMHRH